MSHETSVVPVDKAEFTPTPPSPFASPVVASRSSAEAHDQVKMLHPEGEVDAVGEAGREAMPATTATTMASMRSNPDLAQVQVQPSHSCQNPSSSASTSASAPGIESSIQHPSHLAAESSGNAGHTGVTISSPDTPSSFFSAVDNLAADADAANPNSHSIVTPPTRITPQTPRDVVDSQVSPSYTSTANANPALASQTTIEHPTSTDPTSADSLQPVNTSTDGPADVDAEGEPKKDKMIFTHTTANSIQRRRNYATTNALTDYEADLTSKDRAKQKEAVKKYLAERVKDNWKWEWPQSEDQAALEPVTTIEGAETVDVAWKERDEWLSNASDDGDDMKMPVPGGTTSSHDTPTPTSKKSLGPIRFEIADAVGSTVKKTLSDRKRRRKKRLAEEMAWNEGMKCFVARRDAWTCARKVQKVPTSPITKTITKASVSSRDGGSSTAIEQDDDEQWEDDTEIPIAPPLLPPENAMRASILPGAYNTIYDKVVVQSLTPSCPMNLKDVTRSCVQGWKRDGEWPPKATSPDTLKKKARKMSVASLLGFREQDKTPANEIGNANANGNGNGNGEPREADKEKKGGSGIRRSIQKMLKLGHGGD